MRRKGQRPFVGTLAWGLLWCSLSPVSVVFASEEALKEDIVDFGSGVETLAISPDGKVIAAFVTIQGKDHELISEIQLWDWRVPKIIAKRVILRRGPVDPTRFGPGPHIVRYANSGRNLLVYRYGRLAILDSATLEEVRSVDLGIRQGDTTLGDFLNPTEVREVVVSSGSPRAAVLLDSAVSDDGEIRVYDAESGVLLRSWALTASGVKQSEPKTKLAWRSLSIDATGTRIAIAGRDLLIDNRAGKSSGNSIHVLDADSSKEVREIPLGPLPVVVRFVSSHPLTLASVPVGMPSFPLHSPKAKTPGEYVLSLWSAETGERTRTISGGPGGAHDFLEVSQDGRVAVAYASYQKCGLFLLGAEKGCSAYDYKFRLWDLSNGKAIASTPDLSRRRPDRFLSAIGNVNLSPRGDLFVTRTRGTHEMAVWTLSK